MKPKAPISQIEQLYRSSYEDIAIFNWVEAQRKIIPAMTVEQSIGLWIKHYGGNWDAEGLRTTYCRMQKKFYEASKTTK